MAMGSFNSQQHQMPTAEINMTPLVDVMLVLLIIFMVTAPMIQLGHVELPSVGTLPSPPSEAAIVIVHADGSLALKPNPAARLERPPVRGNIVSLGRSGSALLGRSRLRAARVLYPSRARVL